MAKRNTFYRYLPDRVSFVSDEAPKYCTIYFPLSGIDSNGVKSAITPYLAGDIKIDRYRYLTKPVSREDLRNGLRNFFVRLDGGRIVSAAESGKDIETFVEAGQLWHRVMKKFKNDGLEIRILNFIPATGEDAEIMHVTVTNISGKAKKISPFAAIPIFGRALTNKHDHEHVTALLHRIEQVPDGVIVAPVMLFNEGGHSENRNVYYVFGSEGNGGRIAGSFPTAESFYGEAGTLLMPEAVLYNRKPENLAVERLNGKEAAGAVCFRDATIPSGRSKDYIVIIGVEGGLKDATATFRKFNTAKKVEKALEANKRYWNEKAGAIKFTTGDKDRDSWTMWVMIQPVLRRIFGCSFLPDHDYGKGGKGWRDIWQDLLSLILIEPEGIRDALINNFCGVRIDSSNATVIGDRPGEFIADRNSITRVWMDHGIWPFLTVELYIDQTGDFDILLEETTYFRDTQLSRTCGKDPAWQPEYGNRLKDRRGKIYRGTLLEHILVQHLVQFFNVGEHNNIRLESADWNDGLDMAFKRGESVAFTSFYGGNLLALAGLLEDFARRKKIRKVKLAKELLTLLDSPGGRGLDYGNVRSKKKILFEKYFKSVQPELSGRKADVDIMDITDDLRKKGEWIFEHIREKEKVMVRKGGRQYTWFNGYYDSKGSRVEGLKGGRVHMTLTGQVYPIMSGLAHSGEVADLVRSVHEFLTDKELGGIRLNTDFGLRGYPEMGRAFGFAYGTKENGSFFNHMSIMYAYALYKRGFVKEGRETLDAIYNMCVDTERSKIYPGIPEYFDSEGRGMYHYLTGSGSWFVLLELTEIFGVRGEYGDLMISPKLSKNDFSPDGNARVRCEFAGRNITVSYHNPHRLDYPFYALRGVSAGGKKIEFERIDSFTAKIKRAVVKKLPSQVTIDVSLSDALHME